MENIERKTQIHQEIYDAHKISHGDVTQKYQKIRELTEEFVYLSRTKEEHEAHTQSILK